MDLGQIALATGGELLIGVLYLALPDSVSLGPRWAPLVAVAVLLAPPLLAVVLAEGRLPVWIARLLAIAVTAVVTTALVASLILLVSALPRIQQPIETLKAGLILWWVNVLVFGTWYSEVDGGGPYARRLAGYPARDLLFPQQALFLQGVRAGELPPFRPDFIDYLYVSFGFATAFSASGTPALTRRVKLLSMVEALNSLYIVALVGARLTNVLP